MKLCEKRHIALLLFAKTGRETGSMFTVNDVLNKHYPQVANNPILFKSLSFVLRHLLHEREITEFGETYPHYEDIDFVTEGVKIFIKRSKTDQSGEGMTKGIPYFSNSNYCPVISLKNWIEISEIKSGQIFDISDKSVALTVKKYAAIAGLDSNKYSGHSLRSGFATSTAELGAEERSIMAMTGHKTTQMVRRYIKEANLFKNNALNKIKI